jgi:hypothetical protein
MFHSDVSPLVVQFFDLCIPLLVHAPIEAGMRLLRPILGAIHYFSRQISREVLQPVATLLLDVLDRCHSPHFLAVAKFLLALRPILVTHSQLCGLVGSRGIRSLSDFDLLWISCDAITVTSVLPFLARTSISSKLWHRSCISLLKELVEKFSGRADIKEWFLTLIRRFFIFVSLAAARGKYHNRTLLICESLASLRTSPPWIHQTLIPLASAVASRAVPAYFRAIFPVSPASVDEAAVKELTLYAGIGRFLKAFPFDPLRRTFLQPAKEERIVVAPPANARSSCRKIKVVTPLPVLRKKKRLSKRAKKRRLALAKKGNEAPVEKPVTVPLGSHRRSPRMKKITAT